jgi:hypothetical protein
MLKPVWSHNTTVSRATNFTPFRLMFGSQLVLSEEIKHKSFRTMMETLPYPSEAKDKDLLEPERLKASSESKEISRGNEGMERPESQAKNFQSRGPSSLVEPSHRELQKVGIKMGWVICGPKSQGREHIISWTPKTKYWSIPRMWTTFIVLHLNQPVKANVS